MRTGEAEGGGRGAEGDVEDEGGSDGRGEVLVMVDGRGLTDGRTA